MRPAWSVVAFYVAPRGLVTARGQDSPIAPAHQPLVDWSVHLLSHKGALPRTLLPQAALPSHAERENSEDAAGKPSRERSRLAP
jgi:hypothetical protein